MQTVILTVVVLGVLILVHEAGHYLAARANDIHVHEFSIGFGPLLQGWQRGETHFALRAFPLGGYVRMAGMYPKEGAEDDSPFPPAEPGRAFHEKSVLQRMAVLGAGPAMNFFLAILIFFLVFGFLGIRTQTLEVAEVLPDYPAAGTELRPGDRVISVDGQPVESWSELVAHIEERPGEPIQLGVRRGGSAHRVTVTPAPEQRAGDTVGKIGVRPAFELRRYAPGQALVRGAASTWAVSAGFFLSLWQWVQGGSGLQLIGIVGIGDQLGEVSRIGVSWLMYFIGLLSTSLGLINILPVPALDGARIGFLTVEALRGEPLDPEKENAIHFVGFALLMLLAVFVTYQDILRIS